MTRQEVTQAQKKLKVLTDEFGTTGYERFEGGKSSYFIKKALGDAVPDELNLLSVLAFYNKLKSDREAEIEKAKSEILK